MGTEGVTTFDVSPHDVLSNVLLSCVTFEAFWSAAQTSSQDALDISSGDEALIFSQLEAALAYRWPLTEQQRFAVAPLVAQHVGRLEVAVDEWLRARVQVRQPA